MDIRQLDATRLDDLGNLLASDKASNGCWCMWFILPVKEYHGGRGDKNRSGLTELMGRQGQPPGLVAYDGGEAVGWCAIGPRSRYARALNTPTYRGRTGSHEMTWLLPCLFVHRRARGSGVGEALIRGAVDLARKSGAGAVEAFPYAAGKQQYKETQVGFAPLFERCGFVEVDRPSPARSIMRLEFQVAVSSI